MDQAKHIIAGTGDVGMHAVGRDHDDACLLKHRRCRTAGCRIAAVDHQLNAVFADQLVRGENRLIGFGLVVIGDEFDLLPERTAGRVDILDCHRCRDLCGLAVGRRGTRQRHLEADLDLGLGRNHSGKAERQDTGEAQGELLVQRRHFGDLHGFLHLKGQCLFVESIQVDLCASRYLLDRTAQSPGRPWQGIEQIADGRHPLATQPDLAKHVCEQPRIRAGNELSQLGSYRPQRPGLCLPGANQRIGKNEG